MSKLFSAGFRVTQFGLIQQQLLVGSTSAVSAGNTSGGGMERISLAKALPGQIPQPNYTAITGDDGYAGSIPFENNGVRNTDLTVAAFDSDQVNFFQGTTKQTYGNNIEATVHDAKGTTPPTIAILTSSIAKEYSTSGREIRWYNELFPSCQITPIGAGLSEQEALTFGLPFTYGPVNKTPLGESIDASGWSSNGAGKLSYYSKHPLTMWTWIGDGTEDTFTLPYEAASDGDLIVFEGGEVQTVTTDYTVSASSGSTDITFTSAPADGTQLAVLVEITEAQFGI